ncbi:YchJ family metal-binding protein [Nocardioides sp. GY 10127]|uniref:YchJ family protein n=1 Tax=Nocardioides sp. GY 10127 TaxID=2569762 RepID=UPI0010A8D7EE|nr:YchJ family metal-binding protein [Nocardioides sp. GY 10127]TIC81815.1 zinc chelation protein SecC [Nocardioides sp. GY 10127]
MLPSAGPCPCGSGRAYDACCGPLHRGAERASTPEQLMRSRYAAFARGEADYLFRTWHPRTRPDDVGVDATTTWTGLEVHGSGLTPADPDDPRGTDAPQEGWVEFTAHYAVGGARGRLHERSRFVLRAGHWLYLDGVHD